MKSFFGSLLLAIIFAGMGLVLWQPAFVLALTKEDRLKAVGGVATNSFGVTDTSLAQGDAGDYFFYKKIADFVLLVLRYIGVVMVIIIIYAGYLWMSAGGNTEQVGKAKQWLINSLIGLTIIAVAHLITGMVLNWVF